jgi:hypothetical protein
LFLQVVVTLPWAEFMEDLRQTHLRVKRRRQAGAGVRERAPEAYEVAARNKRRHPERLRNKILAAVP